MAFIDTLLAPLEANGIALLDTERTALMALATNADQKVVDEAVNVINENLPTKGVIALVDGGLKVALVAAKPQIVNSLTHVENAFIDAVENALKADLARRAAPSAPKDAPSPSQTTPSGETQSE